MSSVQMVLLIGIRIYRLILSPAKQVLFGPLGRCRFTPSCSAYALEAIQTHRAARGSWLALRRLCRCHPWGGCGCDPVPQAKQVSRPGVGTARPSGASSHSALQEA